MSDIAIKVENLSKRYRIGLKEQMHDTFVGAITSWIKSPISDLRQLRKLTKFEELPRLPRRSGRSYWGEIHGNDNAVYPVGPGDRTGADLTGVVCHLASGIRCQTSGFRFLTSGS